jgi:hypothetical protein
MDEQDQKIAPSGSPNELAGQAHFSTDEKKGLAKQDLS